MLFGNYSACNIINIPIEILSLCLYSAIDFSIAFRDESLIRNLNFLSYLRASLINRNYSLNNCVEKKIILFFCFSVGWLAIYLIVFLEIGVTASILCFGTHFVDFFTTDEPVRKLAKESLTFLSVFCFFDAVQGVISGILRGSGKQMIGAVANIIAFYVIGLPLAYYFCFKTSLGITGLMLGLSGGVFFQDIVSLFLITCCESLVFPLNSGDKIITSANSIGSSQHGLIYDIENDDENDDVVDNINDNSEIQKKIIAIKNLSSMNSINNVTSDIEMKKISKV